MKPRRKPRQTEHAIQKAVIQTCRMLEGRYPELRYILAIPNGGHRHPAVAAKLKVEGVRGAGYPIYSRHCQSQAVLRASG